MTSARRRGGPAAFRPDYEQVATSFSIDAMVDGVLAGYEQALDRAALSGRPTLASA